MKQLLTNSPKLNRHKLASVYYSDSKTKQHGNRIIAKNLPHSSASNIHPGICDSLVGVGGTFLFYFFG